MNSADDPANCTFILPAVARDGEVTVAVSTGGASPALASHLRGEIEDWLGQIGAADAAVALAGQRSELRAAGYRQSRSTDRSSANRTASSLSAVSSQARRSQANEPLGPDEDRR